MSFIMNSEVKILEIQWYLKTFSELTPKILWSIYQLRKQVFVVEQNCLYPDIDKQDLHSYHLYALDEHNDLVAYCRFYKLNNGTISFGRVVVPKQLRHLGIGNELVKQTLIEIRKLYGHPHIVIHAQYYARNFYQNLGFKAVGEPFKEALRKHVKMIKQL